MNPLSIVFRVDAENDTDARRQLAETIRTAQAILEAMYGRGPVKTITPPVPVDPTGKPIRTHEPVPQEAEPGPAHVHVDPATGRRSFRPWQAGEKGMGE